MTTSTDAAQPAEPTRTVEVNPVAKSEDEIDLDSLCLMRGKADNGWMSVGNRRCSLPKDHTDPEQHIAYVQHKVTGNGADVFWLGPWEDDRPYEGELTDRLTDEWSRRYD